MDEAAVIQTGTRRNCTVTDLVRINFMESAQELAGDNGWCVGMAASDLTIVAVCSCKETTDGKSLDTSVALRGRAALAKGRAAREGQ